MNSNNDTTTEIARREALLEAGRIYFGRFDGDSDVIEAIRIVRRTAQFVVVRTLDGERRYRIRRSEQVIRNDRGDFERVAYEYVMHGTVLVAATDDLRVSRIGGDVYTARGRVRYWIGELVDDTFSSVEEPYGEVVLADPVYDAERGEVSGRVVYRSWTGALWGGVPVGKAEDRVGDRKVIGCVRARDWEARSVRFIAC